MGGFKTLIFGLRAIFPPEVFRLFGPSTRIGDVGDVFGVVSSVLFDDSTRISEAIFKDAGDFFRGISLLLQCPDDSPQQKGVIDDREWVEHERVQSSRKG